MRVSVRRSAAVAAVAVLALSGCGGGGTEQDTTQSSQSPSPSTSAPGQSSPGDSPSEDSAVEIEVEIENGTVTPSGERVDVQVGQPIRFVVDSDAADEIHVHSTPEHSFSFKAGADDREFTFKLTQPGVVEAELHELGDVVVTLAARP